MNGNGYTFKVSNPITEQSFYVTFDCEHNKLSFTITASDDMLNDPELDYLVGKEFSDSAYGQDPSDPYGNGYDLALERLASMIYDITEGVASSSDLLVENPIYWNGKTISAPVSGFFSQISKAQGDGRIELLDYHEDPSTGIISVEFCTRPGILPGGQVWNFRTSVDTSSPGEIEVQNQGDGATNWMKIPFSQFTADAWIDQVLRPIGRIGEYAQSIGFRIDPAMQQPGSLAQEIVPVISIQADSKGVKRPYVLFTIPMDAADGSTFEYQCQMQLIDNPSASGGNNIKISINGFSIGGSESSGHKPLAFAEYFTKMAELHSQIVQQGGQFVAGTGGDPHVECMIKLRDVSLSASYANARGWIGIWVKYISDARTQSKTWITEDTQIMQESGPGSWFFNDVNELNTLLMNRENLITDVQKIREGKAAYLTLTYNRFPGSKSIVNGINYRVEYSLSVQEFDPSTGKNLIASPLPLDLVGYMDGVSGKVYMQDDSGNAYNIGDRLSSAMERLNSLSEDSMPGTYLLLIPGKNLIGFSHGAAPHDSVFVNFASEIEEDTSGKRVFANFAMDLRTGELYLTGYMIPVGGDISKWVVNPYYTNINLGISPNANPTIELVLAKLACPEITINPGEHRGMRDGVFRIRLQVTAPDIVLSDPTVNLLVFYDPTSTSSNPDITGIKYSLGDRYNKQYTLDDTSPTAMTVTYQGVNGIPQSPTFIQWLEEANGKDYSKLSWTQAYSYFITYLRGPSVWDLTHWDTIKWPLPKV